MKLEEPNSEGQTKHNFYELLRTNKDPSNLDWKLLNNKIETPEKRIIQLERLTTSSKDRFVGFTNLGGLEELVKWIDTGVTRKSHEFVIRILNCLNQDLEITIEQLDSSQLGQKILALKNTLPNETITSLVNALLKRWKKMKNRRIPKKRRKRLRFADEKKLPLRTLTRYTLHETIEMLHERLNRSKKKKKDNQVKWRCPLPWNTTNWDITIVESMKTLGSESCEKKTIEIRNQKILEDMSAFELDTPIIKFSNNTNPMSKHNQITPISSFPAISSVQNVNMQNNNYVWPQQTPVLNSMTPNNVAMLQQHITTHSMQNLTTLAGTHPSTAQQNSQQMMVPHPPPLPQLNTLQQFPQNLNMLPPQMQQNSSAAMMTMQQHQQPPSAPPSRPPPPLTTSQQQQHFNNQQHNQRNFNPHTNNNNSLPPLPNNSNSGGSSSRSHYHHRVQNFNSNNNKNNQNSDGPRNGGPQSRRPPLSSSKRKDGREMSGSSRKRSRNEFEKEDSYREPRSSQRNRDRSSDERGRGRGGRGFGRGRGEDGGRGRGRNRMRQGDYRDRRPRASNNEFQGKGRPPKFTITSSSPSPDRRNNRYNRERERKGRDKRNRSREVREDRRNY